MESPDRIWYDSVSYVRPPLVMIVAVFLNQWCKGMVNQQMRILFEWKIWKCQMSWHNWLHYLCGTHKNPTPSRCWAMKTGFWSAEHTTDWRFSRHPKIRRAACLGFHCHQDCVESWKRTICLPLRAWIAERVTTWLFLLKRNIVINVIGNLQGNLRKTPFCSWHVVTAQQFRTVTLKRFVQRGEEMAVELLRMAVGQFLSLRNAKEPQMQTVFFFCFNIYIFIIILLASSRLPLEP